MWPLVILLLVFYFSVKCYEFGHKLFNILLSLEPKKILCATDVYYMTFMFIYNV